jgi:Cytochrome P460
VATGETAFDEFRGILGNAAALQAYRDGTLPFPDGARFAKLAWKASMGYVALACDLHGEACLTNH